MRLPGLWRPITARLPGKSLRQADSPRRKGRTFGWTICGQQPFPAFRVSPAKRSSPATAISMDRHAQRPAMFMNRRNKLGDGVTT